MPVGWSWTCCKCYEAFGATVACKGPDCALRQAVRIEPWGAAFGEASTQVGFMMGPTLFFIFRVQQPIYRLSSYNCVFYSEADTWLSI
jgi:hypothetical protein